MGAADGNEIEWKYTNGASSGSLSLPLTSGILVPGTQYEVRLYANDAYTLLASGGQFTLASSTGTAATSKVYYIHNDHLGTPQALTNEAGSKVWSAVYDPYGNATITGTIVFNVRMPGQYYDLETGLSYNLNRYYDPVTGRYITSDPIGLDGGINTYAYVENNPLNYFDFEGLSPEKGERGYSGGAGGTSDPGKHWKDDPERPGWGWQKDPQTGKNL